MSVIIQTLDQLRAAIDKVNHHFVSVHVGPYAPITSITRAEAHNIIATLPADTSTTDTLGLGRLYDDFVVIGRA